MVQAKAVTMDCTKSFMQNYNNPFSQNDKSVRQQMDCNISKDNKQKKKFINLNEIADEDEDHFGNKGKKCNNFKF